MTSPFSPHANARLRWAIVVGVGLSIGAPVALMAWVRTPYAQGRERALEQPVAFDHRHHVVDDGIDCRYCHSEVERSPTAGIPASSVCINCHSQIWNESPLLEPVRASFYERRPLEWKRVHRLPDFVYFDHSIHIHKGVGCETCHGRVDGMARVYQVAPLTMGWCLDCHRDPAPNLRPRDAVTIMGWQPPAGETREELGRHLMARYDVNPPTDCSGCHR